MDWSAITTAIGHVWDLVEGAITFITTNPALMVLFSASLVPIGFKIFRKAKKSVR
jgi:hypothetical protein